MTTAESASASAPLQGRSVAIGSGLTAAAGVVAVMLGIIVLAWPGATLLVIAILFGVQLAILGVFRIIVGTFTAGQEGWMRALYIVTGLIVLVVGIVCFKVPRISIEILIALTAVGWMVDGIVSVAVGVHTATSRWIPIVLGGISVLAAFVLLVSPITSAAVLVLFGGWMLVILGLSAIISTVLGLRKRTA